MGQFDICHYKIPGFEICHYYSHILEHATLKFLYLKICHCMSFWTIRRHISSVHIQKCHHTTYHILPTPFLFPIEPSRHLHCCLRPPSPLLISSSPPPSPLLIPRATTMVAQKQRRWGLRLVGVNLGRAEVAGERGCEMEARRAAFKSSW